MRKKGNPPKKEAFPQRLAQMLKLPEDLVYKEPVVTMFGSHQLRIENYQNLLEYRTDKIVIRIQRYRLVVIGKAMEIVCYTNDEMYISGEIFGISYEN